MQNKEATKRFDARMSELSDFVEMQVRTPQDTTHTCFGGAFLARANGRKAPSYEY